MRRLRRASVWAAGGLALLVLAWAALWAFERVAQAEGHTAGDAPVEHLTPVEQVTRGAYLARVGDCAACHTLPGGAAYAGGRGIETPFGVVYASNLTPDASTGLGQWTADDFWQALHHGRSRDGHLLYPAFPYPEYTRVTRIDADALFAFLRSVPPVQQVNRAHGLRFPYRTQTALALWRALYFRPGVWQETPQQSPEWNRGAYLVEGLGHCGSCHTPRNALGAPDKAAALAGALVPGAHWWAPALQQTDQAGVAHWPQAEVVALLTTGVAAQAGVSGPMAEVVWGSLQYLTADDAQAMATYLRSLPVRPGVPRAAQAASSAVLARGRGLYDDQCAPCHGTEGQGKPGAFAALAGNRAVVMAEPLNVIQIVLRGGYLPATAGNPRPHGMPPFRQALSDADIADVISYIRSAWGNQAGRVTAMDVHRASERLPP